MDRYSFSPNLQAIPILCAVLFPFWLDDMHKVSQFLSHEKIDLGNYLISEYLCRVVFNSIPISYMAIPPFPSTHNFVRGRCRAGNKFKVPIQLVAWGIPLVMCITLLALWNCNGPGDHRGALTNLKMSLSLTLPLSTPLPYSAGLSIFYICWISVKNVYFFILLSLLLYLLPLILLTFVSVFILCRALRLLRTKLPASSETRRKILRQNSVFVFVLAVEAVMTVALWVLQICFILLTPMPTSKACCQSFTGNHHFALALLFAVFFHGTRGIVTLCVWICINSIRPKDLRPLYCCHRCCHCKTHRFPAHITTPLVQSESGVNQALRRDAMYCINVGILRVIDSDIQRQKEQQGCWDSGTRDDLGLVIEDYLYQEERERGDATLEDSLRQPGQEQTVTLTLNQLDRERTFDFTEIEPVVFSRLRECYRTDLDKFRESFRIQDLQDIESSGMLEKFTEGKSGSFFYFTHDFRFIIKTVTDSELGTMRQIAVPYFWHMKANPDTFLPRFFGLYRVRLAREQKFINVVVMDNIFHTTRKLVMHRKFDLKGSTLGRRVVRGHLSSRDRYKGTLKDLDLQEKISVGADNKARILAQLHLDTQFLAQHHIMDYSLLLGIHQHSPHDTAPLSLVVKEGQQGGFTVVDELTFGTDGKTMDSTFGGEGPLSSPETAMVHIPWFRQDFGGLRSTALHHPAGPTSEGDANTIELQPLRPAAELGVVTVSKETQSSREMIAETYFMGIIDILQEYNWLKRLEHVWKSRVRCHQPYSISAINAADYRRRFVEFMANSFE